jgi:hypothetical protein
MTMRGGAKLLGALLLMLLCVSAHFQGAWSAGGGGGRGGGGGGGGGRGAGGGSRSVRTGTGSVRPGTGAAATQGNYATRSPGQSAAGDPHGRSVWITAGAAAGVAAAALVWR